MFAFSFYVKYSLMFTLQDETVSSSSEMFSATWPDDDESTTSLSVLKRHRDDQPNY